MTHLIRIYHSFDKDKQSFEDFLDTTYETLKGKTFTLGLHYLKGEIFYSLDIDPVNYPAFESLFYSRFNDFQIVADDKKIWNYDKQKTVLGELYLENEGYYPFKMDHESDVIATMFRTFENFDLINDKVSFFVEFTPVDTANFLFYLKTKLKHRRKRKKIDLLFFKYLFIHTPQKNWKAEGKTFFKKKFRENLFEIRTFIIAQSDSKASAEGKIQSLFNNFSVFKNHLSNQFLLRKIHHPFPLISQLKRQKSNLSTTLLSSEEVATFFHFPNSPKNESSLFTVKSKKLALPVGVPSFDYTKDERGEVYAVNFPREANIVGISDYRSITVPVGIYDEDRLRHMYVIGKTGTGKSKFLLNLMINDIQQGKGIGIIDPHGDSIEEVMTYIPSHRQKDVIIFDPTDIDYPFCMNPLDVNPDESKQVLAKGFIDIFKKFFGANWNSKLEHVLRMIFLALLDKKGSTLFDIIRALTDKDFRYDMIESIQDDVVRNFWTNEFAGRSQQFNTEAIMPILNKVGQLLSIDMLKNIFASSENKLDLRKIMDEQKILLVKLPKGQLQEDIMGFLGAMFVTKLFQTAMGRQSLGKNERKPFFLYVDEFQNFTTDTFSEILSEARKYGLSLIVAHQFIKQIPSNISDALFGNVGTLISFRVSSEDAEYIKQHFQPFLSGYDLANLNMREFYCKLLVQGQVKDPFSLKACWTPDVDINRNLVDELYRWSRKQYARSLSEAKQVVSEQQQDVIKVIEEFVEPIV
ncbi:MAG TPA: type IV secretion system DNA-binding domain-containing protein [Candidatus Absconditabacterales bacterium]|nr:type IV secretion system DNA-binding domain-containing protein [Candidatus Absconditabacterales bacterium]HOQ78899.1 type IV secretion system DNA-binding domain-containing protein [Candidatus Absconditabacterales bacterium]HPK27790.1 type IV secretion system DNA-binding domain-containing protein [Candidatus Absconditabacterales bacterium]